MFVKKSLVTFPSEIFAALQNLPGENLSRDDTLSCRNIRSEIEDKTFEKKKKKKKKRNN